MAGAVSVVIVEIDALGIFRMAFETASHATPERLLRSGIEFIGSAHQRQEIAHNARLCVLLAEDMVEECSLIIVGDCGICRPAEKMTGKLEHVVGAA